MTCYNIFQATTCMCRQPSDRRCRIKCLNFGSHQRCGCAWSVDQAITEQRRQGALVPDTQPPRTYRFQQYVTTQSSVKPVTAPLLRIPTGTRREAPLARRHAGQQLTIERQSQYTADRLRQEHEPARRQAQTIITRTKPQASQAPTVTDDRPPNRQRVRARVYQELEEMEQTPTTVSDPQTQQPGHPVAQGDRERQSPARTEQARTTEPPVTQRNREGPNLAPTDQLLVTTQPASASEVETSRATKRPAVPSPARPTTDLERAHSPVVNTGTGGKSLSTGAGDGQDTGRSTEPGHTPVTFRSLEPEERPIVNISGFPLEPGVRPVANRSATEAESPPDTQGPIIVVPRHQPTRGRPMMPGDNESDHGKRPDPEAPGSAREDTVVKEEPPLREETGPPDPPLKPQRILDILSTTPQPVIDALALLRSRNSRNRYRDGRRRPKFGRHGWRLREPRTGRPSRETDGLEPVNTTEAVEQVYEMTTEMSTQYGAVENQPLEEAHLTRGQDSVFWYTQDLPPEIEGTALLPNLRFDVSADGQKAFRASLVSPEDRNLLPESLEYLMYPDQDDLPTVLELAANETYVRKDKETILRAAIEIEWLIRFASSASDIDTDKPAAPNALALTISAYAKAAGWQCLSGILELALQLGRAAREWRGDPSLGRVTRSTLREAESAAALVKQIEAAQRISDRHEASLNRLRGRSPERFESAQSSTTEQPSPTTEPSTTTALVYTSTQSVHTDTDIQVQNNSFINAVWSIMWEIPSNAVAIGTEAVSTWVWQQVLFIWYYLRFVLIVIGVLAVCGCGARLGCRYWTHPNQLAAVHDSRPSDPDERPGELAFLAPWASPAPDKPKIVRGRARPIPGPNGTTGAGSGFRNGTPPNTVVPAFIFRGTIVDDEPFGGARAPDSTSTDRVHTPVVIQHTDPTEFKSQASFHMIGTHKRGSFSYSLTGEARQYGSGQARIDSKRTSGPRHMWYARDRYKR